MDINMIKALSDGTRLRIIERLSRRVHCVKALSYYLGVSESAISQHMKILRDAGLVEGVKYGYYTHYRLRRDALGSLADDLKAISDTQETDGLCEASDTIGCKKS